MEGLMACYESSVDKYGELTEATKSPKSSSSLSGDKSSIVFHSKVLPTSSNNDVIVHKSKKQHCKKVHSSTIAQN
jgi:hypothetical protein